jgi:hypothetical protein
MNAGKGMAQASHASNAFLHSVNQNTALAATTATLVEKWKNETEQGFGTAIVLAVNETDMRIKIEIASTLGYVAGIVHDPGYPIRDGQSQHEIPLDTCAFAFGDRNETPFRYLFSDLDLHD